jgi:phage/plasmid-like protein (TIGR03299 family)
VTKVIASKIMIGFGRNSLQSSATTELYSGAIPAADVRDHLFGWDAVPAPLFASVNGSPVVVPNMVANVRSDNGAVLGLVSERYAIHQYSDSLVSAVERITGAGTDLGISAAGTNRNGAVGWVSVSLPDTRTTAEGVEYLPNLIAYGSHDGSLVTGYKRSVLNMVCNNQMGSMLHTGATAVRVKHTRNSVLRLESAQHALGILAETADTFAEGVRELCQLPVSEADFAAFLAEFAPIPTIEDGANTRGLTMAENKRDALSTLWASDARVSPWRGTAYGVVQAVNTYSQHVQTVRGAHRDERNLLSTLSGDWDALDTNTAASVRRVLARRA